MARVLVIGGTGLLGWELVPDCSMTKSLIRIPIPLTLGRALREGYLTEPGARHGAIIWEEWLGRRYAGTSTQG
jgi:hypothetical protein